MINSFNFFLFLMTITEKSLPLDISDTYVENVCYCVPIGRCWNGASTTSSYEVVYGARASLEPSDNSLDARIMNFNRQEANWTTFNVDNPNIQPVSSGAKLAVNNQTTCQDGLELCCPVAGYECGIAHPPVKNSPTRMENDYSSYGAHPWHAAVLSQFNEFLGTGVLIDHRHVLTVAHKVFRSSNIKCRIGDWSAETLSEPLLPQEIEVSDNNIIIHPNFTDPRTITNDVAILRTNSPGFLLGAAPTVSPACLPNQQIYEQRCWIAGWGTSNFSSGQFETVLKEVNLPLINNSVCQEALRNTRLGANFILDAYSFICAGSEPGKDACTGDGGSGLVCSVNNKFFLVGLVAWGIGCGSASIPGVYVNIQSFIPWIQTTIEQLELRESELNHRTRKNSENSKKNQFMVFNNGQKSGDISASRRYNYNNGTIVKNNESNSQINNNGTFRVKSVRKAPPTGARQKWTTRFNTTTKRVNKVRPGLKTTTRKTVLVTEKYNKNSTKI